MVKGGVPKQLSLDDPDIRERALGALAAIAAMAPGDDLPAILRSHPLPHGTFAKSQLLIAYHSLVEEGTLSEIPSIERQLRGRPVRTASGVAPVAVLTEPYPCPGSCIFCPDQKDAPKSYLDGEPGVLRAIQNAYDPYQQTKVRIDALATIGHAVDKVELLVLGGTWSSYPESYQECFLRRCFDAMNGMPSASLEQALQRNETAPHRNVGLVIETRPDSITPEEVVRLRKQGVTKVQIGAQSFDDIILDANHRGHSLADVYDAMRLLRLGGFKIVLHWMPNLYKATLASDLEDFSRLWDDPHLRPDELKIYPTALLEGTQLHQLYQQGEYAPYSEADLIDLLVQCKLKVQPYSRINRLMRDIPAGYIVAGTTKSNLRQIVQHQMKEHGQSCQCIRCREMRTSIPTLELSDLRFDIVEYDTDGTHELFTQALVNTDDGEKLAGFLRLSLPEHPRDELPQPDISTAAMIREVHVYGPAQELGSRKRGAQHRGLGTHLIEMAVEASVQRGFTELAVIAAVGTRGYYASRGFTEGSLYPIRKL